MDKINLIDRTFAHSKIGYCSDYQSSDLFRWDRTSRDGDIVYTDMVLNSVTPNQKGNNYAWLIEPIDVASNNYNLIEQIKGKYNKVFTHEKTLIDRGAPYEFVPFGCCWIKPEDHKIWPKSKVVSIIASNKTATGGHKLRHQVVKSNPNLDVYGRTYNPLDYKLDGIKDYRFHVVIENCKRDYWFTEKLIDCLVTGTVPIYWGCPSIGDFFDTRGFIIVDTLEDINMVLNVVSSSDLLTEEKYNEMLPYIESNLEKAKQFLLPDEWVYKKIKKI